MPFLKWTVAVALVAALGTAASAQLLRPYPYHVDFPYEVVPDHFKPNFPEGRTWGSVDGIYAESPNRVYVFQSGTLLLPAPYAKLVGANGFSSIRDNDRYFKLVRREYVLTVYDRNGNRIEHWKELDAIAQHSHHIKVDPSDRDKHVWLVNQAFEPGKVAILKVTRDGRVVMTVGSDDCPIAQDIAFLPNGDFWCLSGMGSPGVRKFSKGGKLIPGTEFANKVGSGPYELNRPHSIIIDRRGRIYIGDRDNFRIQVYDQNGKYLETWPAISARSMAIDKNDRLWVICAEDQCGKDMAPYSMSAHDLNNGGKVLFAWGVGGSLPGQFFFSGQFDVDSEGNLYMGEVGGGRVQKWRPRNGANPNHLIQWPLVR